MTQSELYIFFILVEATDPSRGLHGSQNPSRPHPPVLLVASKKQVDGGSPSKTTTAEGSSEHKGVILVVMIADWSRSIPLS